MDKKHVDVPYIYDGKTDWLAYVSDEDCHCGKAKKCYLVFPSFEIKQHVTVKVCPYCDKNDG